MSAQLTVKQLDDREAETCDAEHCDEPWEVCSLGSGGIWLSFCAEHADVANMLEAAEPGELLN